MTDQLAVILGYFWWKALRPCCTSASSAGDDDQPATVRVMLPLSALAALPFVLAGQVLSAFCGPFAPAPVPPLPPFEPHAASTDSKMIAPTTLHVRRT